MSYFSQMVGLAVHNFTSAATGMAIAIALVRGIARRSASTIGNFWVDLVRSTLYVLLPISVVFAVVLVAQGTPQTLGAYVDATTLEGATQTIAHRAGRQPGDHQGARHQRRRLLQRQLGPPVREPEPADQPHHQPRDHRRSRPRCSTPSAGWSATPARAGRSGRRRS